MNWEFYKGLLIGYTIRVLIALIIVVIGKYISKKLSNLIRLALQKSKVDSMLSNFLSDLAYYALFIIGVIIALSTLGFKTTSLAAIVGAVTLAVGLSLQGNLSNLGSGVIILLTRPFKIGDFVDVGGITGSVEKITVFNTELLTPDNKRIIVPNSNVIGNPITNFSANEKRRVDMVVGIGYDSDIKKAKEIICSILDNDERVLKEPKYTVAVSELAESSINIIVRPWVKSSDYWSVKFDFLEMVKEEFDKNGINIPYPQMDVHLKKKD